MRKRVAVNLRVAAAWAALMCAGVVCIVGRAQDASPKAGAGSSSPQVEKSGESVGAKTKASASKPSAKDDGASEVEKRLCEGRRLRAIDALRAAVRSADDWKDARRAARVQARAADVIWDADESAGRALLLSAWKSAGRVEEKRKEFW